MLDVNLEVWLWLTTANYRLDVMMDDMADVWMEPQQCYIVLFSDDGVECRHSTPSSENRSPR